MEQQNREVTRIKISQLLFFTVYIMNIKGIVEITKKIDKIEILFDKYEKESPVHNLKKSYGRLESQRVLHNRRLTNNYLQKGKKLYSMRFQHMKLTKTLINLLNEIN